MVLYVIIMRNRYL